MSTSFLARAKANRAKMFAYKRGASTIGFKPVKRGKSISTLVKTGGLLGIENKFLDQTKTGTAVVSTLAGAEVDPASTNCINAIAQGDGESNRDGRRYVITGVHVRGSVYRQNRNNQSEVGDANFVTVALVLDTQTNGTQLSSEDVFTVPAGGSPALSFNNLKYSQRFRVLWKKTMVVPAGYPTWNGTADQLETGGTAVTFSIDKELHIDVNCLGTAADVSDIVDNSLHMIAFADTSGSNNNGIEIIYNSRVRFVG